MSKTKVVINLYGGLVQEVFCSDQDADIVVVDWDTETCPEADPDITRITTENGLELGAIVREFDAAPIKLLAGTDCDAAIKLVRGPRTNRRRNTNCAKIGRRSR